MSPVFIRSISFFLIGLFLAFSSQIVCFARITWRNYFLSLLFCLITGAADTFLVNDDSPLKLLLMVVNILIIYLVVNRFRGTKLLLCSFAMLMVSFGGDILTGAILIQLFDSTLISAMRYQTSPLTWIMQMSSGGVMVLLALLLRLGVRLLKKLRRKPSRVGYLLRPLCMLGIICSIFARTVSRLSGTTEASKFLSILPEFVIIILLLIIGITYITQDIRFFRQTEEKQALLYQQSLQDLLLQDTRIFRHNVSNMLYGLQGTLLGGDLSAVQSYYDSMVEACQLINNENVVALKRIPSPAVGMLLLNKLHQASSDKIPFFITVLEDIRWHALRDHEMTQILGILLDNAIEAAQESAAPLVSFEARNIGNSLSITIRNTYAGAHPPLLSLQGESTKPGHEGLGLKSLRKLLKNHPRALFSIYPSGRYVEAVLSIE